MNKSARCWFACAIILLSASSASAQAGQQPARPAVEPLQACTTPRELGFHQLSGDLSDFARVVELAGHAPVKPRLIRRASNHGTASVCAERGRVPWQQYLRDPLPGSGPTLELLPVRWFSHVNSAYPRDRNNGAVWAGRGVSTQVGAGVELRWGPLTAAIAPTMAYQQNADFDFVAMPRAHRSPFAYPWHSDIDWPVRFGAEDFWTFHPGASYVRVDAYGAAVGVSTENLWFGPALRNPIVLSNTGPGFPHVFVGTSEPVDIRVGRLEGQLFWGRLTESEYFDGSPDNDRRLFAGLILDFEPRWIPGLFLGAARMYMGKIPANGLGPREFLVRPYRDPFVNQLGPNNPRADNEILAVFARWVHPASGFETYIEWAREDHWQDVIELLKRPESSRAYTVGFQKVFTGSTRWFRLFGEYTQLEDAPPVVRANRLPITYYTHGGILQGYTNRGQMLGAAIGPGSNSQTLGLDMYTGGGKIGLSLERTRYDADAYNEVWARHYYAHGHDLELSAGLHQLVFFHEFEIAWGLGYSWRENRNFIDLNGINWAFRVDNNWTLDLRVTWQPDLLLHLDGTRTAAVSR